MEKDALFQKIDCYASTIRNYRPLSDDELKQLDAYFKIGVTYSSNALEGNSLTLSETKVLLEDGITVGGKPIRDCYEATGHARAYDFMLELARNAAFIFTEGNIKRLHYLFYNGIDPEKAGLYRKGQVFITGTEYVPPPAEEVPHLMAALSDDLNAKKDKLHPVELSAYAHRRLVDIHPFQDGNGRTARLLMNLILVNNGYCVVSIPPVLRHEYITALQQAQRSIAPSDAAFIRLIAECEIEAQKDYCRMFRIKLPNLSKDPPEREKNI
jgi:Fic family protein